MLLLLFFNMVHGAHLVHYRKGPFFVKLATIFRIFAERYPTGVSYHGCIKQWIWYSCCINSNENSVLKLKLHTKKACLASCFSPNNLICFCMANNLPTWLTWLSRILNACNNLKSYNFDQNIQTAAQSSTVHGTMAHI